MPPVYEADEGNEREGLLLDNGNEPYGTDALDASLDFASLMEPVSALTVLISASFPLQHL